MKQPCRIHLLNNCLRDRAFIMSSTTINSLLEKIDTIAPLCSNCVYNFKTGDVFHVLRRYALNVARSIRNNKELEFDNDHIPYSIVPCFVSKLSSSHIREYVVKREILECLKFDDWNESVEFVLPTLQSRTFLELSQFEFWITVYVFYALKVPINYKLLTYIVCKEFFYCNTYLTIPILDARDEICGQLARQINHELYRNFTFFKYDISILHDKICDKYTQAFSVCVSMLLLKAHASKRFESAEQYYSYTKSFLEKNYTDTLESAIYESKGIRYNISSQVIDAHIENVSQILENELRNNQRERSVHVTTNDTNVQTIPQQLSRFRYLQNVVNSVTSNGLTIEAVDTNLGQIALRALGFDRLNNTRNRYENASDVLDSLINDHIFNDYTSDDEQNNEIEMDVSEYDGDVRTLSLREFEEYNFDSDDDDFSTPNSPDNRIEQRYEQPSIMEIVGNIELNSIHIIDDDNDDSILYLGENNANVSEDSVIYLSDNDDNNVNASANATTANVEHPSSPILVESTNELEDVFVDDVETLSSGEDPEEADFPF
ncbi:hypothetical protein HT594_00126 [Phenacoccus solenopsis nudivirus]|nr:hypothetical protein HT594_00126 [Phenacoccus solenopsis nudivirus]